MKKITKNILGLCIIAIALSFGSNVQANNGLKLEMVEDCNIQYAGDSCIVVFKATNETESTLNTQIEFSVSDQGEIFDGVGIDVWFNGRFEDFDWINGKIRFSDFQLETGEHLIDILIKTQPALLSGQYNFVFSMLAGEIEESIIAPIIIYSSGIAVINPYHGTTTDTITTTTIAELIEEIEDMIDELLPEEPIGNPSVKETPDITVIIKIEDGEEIIIEVETVEEIIDEVIHFRWLVALFILLVLMMILLRYLLKSSKNL